MSVDRVESGVWELLAVIYQRIKSCCFVIQQACRKVIMVNKSYILVGYILVGLARQ